MKIQVFSDLHMEFFTPDTAFMGQVNAHPDADVIVLAGDIDSGENSYRQAVALANRTGKRVVWIPGNHEFYNGDLGLLTAKYKASCNP
jgi:predicted phosphodiesterase